MTFPDIPLFVISSKIGVNFSIVDQWILKHSAVARFVVLKFTRQQGFHNVVTHTERGQNY